MNELDNAFIETALRKMIAQGYFSVCTVNEILAVTKSIPNAEIMKRLQLLHCVHFNEMPPEVMEALPGMIREAINGPQFNAAELFRKPATNLISAPAAKTKFLSIFKSKD